MPIVVDDDEAADEDDAGIVIVYVALDLGVDVDYVDLFSFSLLRLLLSAWAGRQFLNGRKGSSENLTPVFFVFSSRRWRKESGVRLV